MNSRYLLFLVIVSIFFSGCKGAGAAIRAVRVANTVGKVGIAAEKTIRVSEQEAKDIEEYDRQLELIVSENKTLFAAEDERVANLKNLEVKNTHQFFVWLSNEFYRINTKMRTMHVPKVYAKFNSCFADVELLHSNRAMAMANLIGTFDNKYYDEVKSLEDKISSTIDHCKSIIIAL